MTLAHFISSLLISGVYLCSPPCTRDDICPQRVKVIERPMETLLSVTYEGDCADNGPYLYLCTEDKNSALCEAPGASFVITSDHSYIWKNTDYNIESTFILTNRER